MFTPCQPVGNPSLVFNRLFGSGDANATQALEAKLGTTDKKEIDEYLTAVRHLKLRVQSTDEGPTCTPGQDPGDIRDCTRAMLDVLAVAFQCDQTRSHHQSDPNDYAALQVIEKWEIEQLAYLFGKLDALQEPDGTVLDNSLIFFFSEIEDGNAHRHINMPIILGGSAGKTLAAGRHLKSGNNPSVGQFFISMLNKTGNHARRWPSLRQTVRTARSGE